MIFLSKKQWAERLGVSTRTIARWNKGDTPIPDKYVLIIEQVYIEILKKIS